MSVFCFELAFFFFYLKGLKKIQFRKKKKKKATPPADTRQGPLTNTEPNKISVCCTINPTVNDRKGRNEKENW